MDLQKYRKYQKKLNKLMNFKYEISDIVRYKDKMMEVKKVGKHKNKNKYLLFSSKQGELWVEEKDIILLSRILKKDDEIIMNRKNKKEIGKILSVHSYDPNDGGNYYTVINSKGCIIDISGEKLRKIY